LRQNHQESLDIARKLAAADPGRAGAKRDLAMSLYRLGDAKLSSGDGPGALAAYQESLDIARKLAAADPGSAEAQRGVSLTLNRLGDVKLRAGDGAGAVAAFEAELQIQRELSKRSPLDRQEQERLGEALGNTASAAILTRQYAKALSLSDEAIAIVPDELLLYTNRADALMLLGKIGEARTLYLAHRGQQLGDGRVWEQGVVGDFDELRKIGVVNPLMDEIQHAFAKPAAKTK
jgi:tetratricopeptide (TPR) repeat protein